MTSRTRAPRSDGALNRERILDAARAALTDTDSEVSMAEIARLSGVGSGTLYRHFATRRELLEILYLTEVTTICEAAAQDSENPARLLPWLREFFEFVNSKRHVAIELLGHTDRSDPVFTASRARVEAAGAPLLHVAQKAGVVHTELGIGQVLDMVVAIAKIPGDDGYVSAILNTALIGLRRPAPSGATPGER